MGSKELDTREEINAMKEMQLIPIGRLQKLYGKNGEVILQCYTNAPQEFNHFYLIIDDHHIPFFFTCLQNKGNNKSLIVIDDFKRNDWIEEWIGQEILYPAEACDSEEDTEGFDACVGFAVIDQSKGELGRIAEFLDYPKNPIYRIEYKGKDILIPIHPDLITDIDIDNRCIKTRLPEGLIETYL